MLTDKQFEKFLKDESFSEISKEQLDKIIDDEMKKPESEIDTELIEYCLNLLDDIDEKTQSDDINKKGSGDKNVKTLKFSFRHIAAVAAVISIVIVAAVSGSASVSHFKMFGGAVEIDGGSVFIDFGKLGGKSEETTSLGDRLITELANNGFSDILIPKALLSDTIIITDTYYEHSELFSTASIKFTYGGKKGCLLIDKAVDDNTSGAVEHPNVTSTVEQVKTDKTTAFCFMQNDSAFSRIVYRYGVADYSIEVPVELEDAVKIAETLN